MFVLKRGSVVVERLVFEIEIWCLFILIKFKMLTICMIRHGERVGYAVMKERKTNAWISIFSPFLDVVHCRLDRGSIDA